jgi:hypothetical protein
MFGLIWLHLHWYQKRLLQYEKANNNNGRTMHKAKSSHGIWPSGLKNENLPNERHKDHYMYEYGKRNVIVH